VYFTIARLLKFDNSELLRAKQHFYPPIFVLGQPPQLPQWDRRLWNRTSLWTLKHFCRIICWNLDTTKIPTEFCRFLHGAHGNVLQIYMKHKRSICKNWNQQSKYMGYLRPSKAVQSRVSQQDTQSCNLLSHEHCTLSKRKSCKCMWPFAPRNCSSS
jgi:hypothetical protein